jgi:hypothetical protein
MCDKISDFNISVHFNLRKTTRELCILAVIANAEELHIFIVSIRD